MKFSTRAEYGLRAMVNLAAVFPDKKNLKKISKQEKISIKYLERLIQELRRAGLVESLRGKDGGYRLIKEPKKISAGEIIEILEGSIAPMNCADNGCVSDCHCSSSLVWIKLGKQIKKTLYEIKLSELI